MTNWQRERVDKAIQDFADEMKCTSCVHRDICFAQKGGVNLMLANTNCKYYKKADDFVEVVRCKNCIHAEPLSSGLFRCKYHTVHTITKSSILNTAPDNYCSWGERREK